MQNVSLWIMVPKANERVLQKFSHLNVTPASIRERGVFDRSWHHMTEGESSTSLSLLLVRLTILQAMYTSATGA